MDRLAPVLFKRKKEGNNNVCMGDNEEEIEVICGSRGRQKVRQNGNLTEGIMPR